MQKQAIAKMLGVLPPSASVRGSRREISQGRVRDRHLLCRGVDSEAGVSCSSLSHRNGDQMRYGANGNAVSYSSCAAQTLSKCIALKKSPSQGQGHGPRIAAREQRLCSELANGRFVAYDEHKPRTDRA